MAKKSGDNGFEKDPANELAKKLKLVSLGKIHQFKKGLDVLSTGIVPIDLACGWIDPIRGNGGIQARSIVELVGENNCYKTGISEQMILATQKRYPGVCVANLYSEPPNTERMEELGIDLDRIMNIGCYHPEIDRREFLAEDSLDSLVKFSELESIKLCIIDSVAALPPSKLIYDKTNFRELEAGAPVAVLANPINNFLKQFIYRNCVSVLLMLNQWRDQITTGFGGRPLTRAYTTGGRGIGFHSDLRILTTGNPIMTEEHSQTKQKYQCGISCNVSLFKMKISTTRAFRKTAFNFDFETKKINNEQRLLEFASFWGHKEGDKIISKLSIPVVKSGSWFYIGDERVQGEENAALFLEEKPDLRFQLEKEIIALGKKYYEDDSMFINNLDEE